MCLRVIYPYRRLFALYFWYYLIAASFVAPGVFSLLIVSVRVCFGLGTGRESLRSFFAPFVVLFGLSF